MAAATYKDKSVAARRHQMLALTRRGQHTVALLALFCALFAVVSLFLRQISYRDPTSYFFDSQRAYRKEHSEQRIAQAERYMQSAGSAVNSPVQVNSAPKICIGVATVARRGDQYVDLTVGSLLEGLSVAQRQEVFLNVLVGHIDQAQHPSFAHKWLDLLPDRVLRYPRDDATAAQILAWEEGGWYRNKTIYDYTYLLRNCYETGAHYVAMIEDDTLAARNWYRETRGALAVVEREEGRSSGSPSWIYLRLFYSDDLHGWNSEHWPKYLFWSSVVWLFCCVSLLAARRSSKRANEYLSLPMLGVILVVCVPGTVGLYFMAGKQTVQPLRAGVQEMNRYGCCSQGLVFPRSVIPDFLDRTDLTTDWLVDMMVEKIADAEGWNRWAMVPPVLQHIGVTSSKGYGFDDSAKRLWSFRFERGMGMNN